MFRNALFSLCLLGSALVAQPAPSPAQKELAQPIQLEDGKATPQGTSPAPEAGPSGFQAFGSLVVVLGLALGSLWALKKYGRKHLPGAGGGRLKVAETLALGDRRYVSIIEAEGERFLIGLHPTGITLLSRLDGLADLGPAPFGDRLEEAVTQAEPISLRDMEAQLRDEGHR